MKILENEPLAPHTYYKIGGPARFWAQPETVADLSELSKFLLSNEMPYFILGAGSNILVDDDGFDGLIIQTEKLNRRLETLENPARIYSGAGIPVIQLQRLCMQRGYRGFEFLVGIPGSMGGVIYMNAGTKAGEAKDFVVAVETYDFETDKARTITGSDLRYSYREQHYLRPHEVILGAEWKALQGSPEEVQKTITDLLAARKIAQPIEKPSCGSVFKNPDPKTGMAAWQAVDKVGLRGYRVGNAQVSPQHSNFIVNLGGAKASDVAAIIAEIKSRVKAQLGFDLHEEVLTVSTRSGKWLNKS